MPSPSEFVAEHVETFNRAVASGDYAPLVARFTDDAVLRLENVPPVGTTLEFAGREALARAYAQNGPDDQIDLTGEPGGEGDHVSAVFAWRRDQMPGVMDFVLAGELVSKLTVTFG